MTKVEKEMEEKIAQYMDAVHSALIAEYGKLPFEWLPQLDQLSDFYRTYLRASEHMKTQPLITHHDGKLPQKNLLLSIMAQSMDSMQKIWKVFGLNPHSKSRIKQGLAKPVSEAAEDDFLANF